MTNEIQSWIGMAGAAVQQMQQQPVAVLLIPVLIVIGGALKSAERFSNRLIPSVLIIIGATANALLGDVDAVSKTQRHPEAVLAMQGMLLAFAAIALHHFLLRRLERFIPFLAGKSGDTVTITKKDTEE